jgi:hypothetical protein
MDREERCGDHHEDLPVTKRVRAAQDEEDNTIPQTYIPLPRATLKQLPGINLDACQRRSLTLLFSSPTLWGSCNFGDDVGELQHQQYPVPVFHHSFLSI